MKGKHILGLLTLCLLVLASCKKSSETVNISTPPLQIGQVVSDANPLSGSIKGTMLTGKTYTIGGDVTVNKGDTLLIQKGVTINVSGAYGFIVKGTLLSLGTKDNQTYITVKGVTKTDDPSVSPANDPAYGGKWTGITCDTSCKLLVLKWTHIEYTGAAFSNPPVPAFKSGDKAYTVYFGNQNGAFVMEDCWIYGCTDDCVRIAGGKIAFFRNTFEKCGYIGGDVLNAKSGTVGDMAYNFFIGCGTNGTKASNKGSNTVQTNVNMYNNTYVNCGYRRVETGRGGCINYEEGSRGMAYNNLIVDCKFGLRIVVNPTADTAHMYYGNTLTYCDSIALANQIYPTGYITKPQSTDIPAPSSFLPTGYTLGATYDGSKVVGKNNPMFSGYSLPVANYKQICAIGSKSFKLATGSPAIGKGNTNFSPLKVVPVSANYGATDITLPGVDLGCYQTNGTGNQH